MAKRLDARVTYNMTVSHAQYKKELVEKGITTHIFDVFFQSELGEMYKGEYLTRESTQVYFLPGQKSRFKVTEAQAFGDVIVPLPHSNQVAEIEVSISQLKPCAGETYSMAAAHAVNLISAHVTMGQAFSVPDLIKNFGELAEGIDAWLINKQRERIVA